MKLIICGLGLHDWETACYAEYEDARAERIACPNHRKRRVCKECGKTQEEDVHCLGSKPYTYIRQWEDVPKIRHDGEGKTEIIVDGAGALVVCDEATNRCYSLVPGGALGGLEKLFPVYNIVPPPPPRGHIKAREARKIAEDSNSEFQTLLSLIRAAAAKGETSLWLKGYCKEIGDDLQVRKLLEGLNYGLNKSGTVDGALVIYW